MKNVLRKIRNELRWAQAFRSSWKGECWRNRWAYRAGYLKENVELCGITPANCSQFLDDRRFMAMHPVNRSVSSIIDNKLYLPLLLKDYPEYCPRYYYYMDERGLIPLADRGSEKGVDAFEDFLALLHREGKLVAKHTHSQVGQGFRLIEYEDGAYRINKRTVDEAGLAAELQLLDEYIVTEYICQHPYSLEINSSSVNTLRLLVAWAPPLGRFELIGAFHRFGCNRNVVDNLGSGNGILCMVDRETGKTDSYGFINFENRGLRQVDDLIHPDSGKCLSGIQIPYFRETRDKILEISDHNRMLRWIAWDVVITPDGGFKVIETNSFPDVSFVQLQFPELKKRMQELLPRRV